MRADIDKTTGPDKQLVTFEIGREEFGLDILSVQEIDRITGITELPQVPEYIEGIINLRGKIVPVMNLRKRLGMEEKSDDQNTRIIVARVDGKTTGFKVDAVKEVLRIFSDCFEPPPDIVAGLRSDFFKSIAKLEDRLLILVDPVKIVSGEKQNLTAGSL